MNEQDQPITAEPAPPPKAIVLISGSGTNLQAIIDAINSGELKLEIAAVISNTPSAYGLERAVAAGINTHVVDHTSFKARELFDASLIRCIEEYTPDIVVLAGFMRILSNDFVLRYLGKLVNIHPSLLPKYPGLNTHQRALDANEAIHGVSVHYVTPELDAGPNIIQAQVDVSPQDNANTLSEKVRAQEHIIYPIALKWMAEGRVRLKGDEVLLDNQTIPSSGLILDSTRVLH